MVWYDAPAAICFWAASDFGRLVPHPLRQKEEQTWPPLSVCLSSRSLGPRHLCPAHCGVVLFMGGKRHVLLCTWSSELF